MKRIAFVAAMILMCLCMAGCASSSSAPSQPSSSVSSSSQAANSTNSSNTLSVGEEIDVSGSIILVSADSFIVDCSGVHFTCIPADSKSLSYITAGNTVEVEGVVASIEDDAITLQNVTIDDYSDGYRNIGDHYEQHDSDHHEDKHHS